MTMIISGSDGVTFPDSTEQDTGYANGIGFRNRIINGDMRIDQRNAGASGTGNDNYTVDRWTYFGSQASKGTWQQNAGSVTPPAGFSNYWGFTSSSAYSVGASEQFVVQQKIEGFNFADLAFGTANARPVSISFWVRSSLTGVFGGSLSNTAINRNYPFSYTISAANTWEYKTVSIAGDTTGTWVGATNGTAARVIFSLGMGSSFSTTANAWNGTTNNHGVTGATSVVGTNGATFYITGVQLEVGSVATPFERRPYTTELQLCQRYLPAWRASSAADPIAGGNQFSTTIPITQFVFPVETRVNPTGIVISNAAHFQWNGGNGGAAISSMTFSAASTKFAVVNGAISASGAIGYSGTLYIVNSSGFIYFTGCEL